MPHQLATNSPSVAAGATTGGHNDHVVIDIDSTGSDNVPCCVVCMEPLEWVAVGRCGHRVVCSVCAARIRCGRWPGHLNCVICRTRCPTVLITKSSAVEAADGVITFSKTPPAPASAPSQDGRAGDYWYFAAMTAYFDDEQHYNEATKAAAAARLIPPPWPSAGQDGGGAPGDDDYGLLLVMLGVFWATMFSACIWFIVLKVDTRVWGVFVILAFFSACISISVACFRSSFTQRLAS